MFDKEDQTKNLSQRNAPHDPSSFIQSYNVTDLKPYTEYVFTVSALNSQGGSGDSNQVQVVTTEDSKYIPQESNFKTDIIRVLTGGGEATGENGWSGFLPPPPPYTHSPFLHTSKIEHQD